jgi:CHAD domain-containing protein
MSFSLQTQESAAEGLRRIFRSQLGNARACVANDGRLTDTEIHNARKSIKRARATLRLLRPALAPAVFKEENLALRDVARPLAPVRDARILMDSLDALRKHYGGAADPVAASALMQRLEAQRMRARREISVSSATMSHLRGVLRRRQTDAKQWHFRMDDWDLLAAALGRIYRNARRAYATVCEARSDERLHEWRKQVKHLWYSLQILAPLRPGVIGEIADQAHKLADHLGDDHDLAVLRKHSESAELDEDAVEILESLIDKRREDLQDRALALGERVFAQKPKQFVGAIEQLWHVWCELAPASTIRNSKPPRRANGAARAHLH